MGYITDKHRKAMILSVVRRWKNGKFIRTMKERRQFDHKKTENLESKFDNLDVNNSYPISPFNFDLGFVCQQLVERAGTFLSLNVTTLRLYLFYVTKNCFILPRKHLKVRCYVYFICLVWGPVRDAGCYIHTHVRAQALDIILLETYIRTWYLLYEKLVISNMNF